MPPCPVGDGKQLKTYETQHRELPTRIELSVDDVHFNSFFRRGKRRAGLPIWSCQAFAIRHPPAPALCSSQEDARMFWNRVVARRSSSSASFLSRSPFLRAAETASCSNSRHPELPRRGVWMAASSSVQSLSSAPLGRGNGVTAIDFGGLRRVSSGVAADREGREARARRVWREADCVCFDVDSTGQLIPQTKSATVLLTGLVFKSWVGLFGSLLCSEYGGRDRCPGEGVWEGGRGRGVDSSSKFVTRHPSRLAHSRPWHGWVGLLHRVISVSDCVSVGGNVLFQDAIKARLSLMTPPSAVVDQLLKSHDFPITPGIPELVRILQERQTVSRYFTAGLGLIIGGAGLIALAVLSHDRTSSSSAAGSSN